MGAHGIAVREAARFATPSTQAFANRALRVGAGAAALIMQKAASMIFLPGPSEAVPADQ